MLTVSKFTAEREKDGNVSESATKSNWNIGEQKLEDNGRLWRVKEIVLV